MGSLNLDEQQIRLIILGLIELADLTLSPDRQQASDLADTLHKHMFGMGLPDNPILNADINSWRRRP